MKLRFAYLTYTYHVPTFGYEPVLVGIHGSAKIALAALPKYQDFPTTPGFSNRIAQRVNEANGQYWYVEKHVVKE